MNQYKIAVEHIEQPDTYHFPKDCLQCTISNDGKSRIFIEEAIPLEPGQAYPIPHIPGMTLIGSVKVDIVNIDGPDYGAQTHVSFRNLIKA